MGFGKDGKGAIIRERIEIDLGALASQTAILATAGGVTLEDDFRIVKTEYHIFTDNFVNGNAFIIGLADGHLTTSQIGACIAANAPNEQADRPGIELAERPVWLLENILHTSALESPYAMAQGEKVFRWTFNDAEGWEWFAYNPLDGSLGGDSQVIILAKHFGVWVT